MTTIPIHPGRRALWSMSLIVAACAATACGDDGATPTSTSGDPGAGGGGLGGGTGVGGEGGSVSTFCQPGSQLACYRGPEGTRGVGVCSDGWSTCLEDGSAFGPCAGGNVPAAETCATPGDDDCDGQTNEEGAGCDCEPGEVASCYSGPPDTEGEGRCRAGTQECQADGSGFGPCEGEVLPDAESCETEEDDDCDGEVNEEGEGCACVPGVTEACYNGPPGTEGVGRCTGGTRTCNDQGTAFGPCQGEVIPAPETCATLDDEDCDGESNEEGAGCNCVPGSTAPCYSGPDGTVGVGACAAGTMTCGPQGTYGDCTGDTTPAAETCSTVADDDCDGLVNEEGDGCVCVPGTTASCYTGPVGTLGVGVCTAGLRACNALGTGYDDCMGDVPPGVEACNGVDDDCDGAADDGDPGGGAACSTGALGACAVGTERCLDAQIVCVPNAAPVPETCNGVDDDCDGPADEDLGTATCGVGACERTVDVCANGSPQACVEGNPTPEVCGDAIDENCNGVLDDGCGPANDERVDAISIAMASPWTTIQATTVGATNDTIGSCGCTGGADVFYTFTLTQSEIVYAETSAATYDTSLFFQDANGTNVASPQLPAGGATCNDDSGLGCAIGLRSMIMARLPAGTHYLVLSGCGAGDATIQFQHLPVGNGALAALPAGASSPAGATSGTGAVSSCGSGPENTYYWNTCPGHAGGSFSAATCGGASYDTMLEQRSATRTPATVCNDDACGLQSSLASTVPAGAGIHVLYVDGFGGGAGSYTVQVVRP